ncbi:MAG: single-stranded DNA-binding protein [Candidatus Cyclonatronum sp.]|uniref:single-stranded DNA-binding protein n=1 Tax=Cyclonatronum sp. TaxID=3024185 RepID=UPI0025C5F192|nr:single-stranded DNA-binding protein [Cyclonatronum sp.]MCC5932984.1 single-stranded DNA-binding protein [Balneolales bacterium]MCH8485299.1 single-stranded DNA-binding protein [Cyclonatronum sp.]
MSSLNKAMVIGNLGADPEVRYTSNNTAVATLSVATSERYRDNNGELQERTEWHRIIAWGKLAELCQNYLKKGNKAYFEGPIQTRQWEDKDGQKRYTTEIKALNIVLLTPPGQGSSGGDYSSSGAASKPGIAASGDVNNFSDNTLNEVEDDLPF